MSNNLGRTEVAAAQNQKEVTINDSDGRIDAALTEITALDATAGNIVVTTSAYQQAIFFNVTNVTVTGRTVTLPTVKRLVVVSSDAANTESFDVVVGSTTVTIATGEKALLYTDGTTNGLVQVSSGGGSFTLTIEDEGVSTVSPASILNFVGSGVTVTDAGSGRATITIPGNGSVLVDWKDSVRAATTANITLSGAQTIDGVSVIAGNRVLVKDQSTASENGIYVAAAGAWSRSTDADEDAEVTAGLTVAVEEGSTNNDRLFILTTNDPITVGVTNLSFSQITGGGGASTFLALSDTPGNFTGAGGQSVRVNSGETALEFQDINYDVGAAFGGSPVANEVVLQFIFPRSVTFPSGLTNSQGEAGVAATAQTDFDIRRDNISVGTMRFAAAGTVATFIMASATTFTAGQQLTIVAPGTADATLADLVYTLAGAL